MARFKDRDVCTVLVADLEEAVGHPHFIERGLFREILRDGDGRSIPALPVPVCVPFRQSAPEASPALGAANNMLANGEKS
jgi:crotonobetainyl-CoA:carnitine CoA-transferase CaiB-like acyl-CoA transferase